MSPHGRSIGLLVLVAVLGGCELLPRPGDTQGEQHQALWTSRGRLAVDTDPKLTIVQVRIDSSDVVGRRDVLLTRFEFGTGGDAAYELALGLDFGDTRNLALGRAYAVGGAKAQIPAAGTVKFAQTPLPAVDGTVAFTRGAWAWNSPRVVTVAFAWE